MTTEPFYWEARKGWYLWTRDADNKRRRVFLAEKKTEAYTKWKAGLANSLAEISGDPTFENLSADWLSRQILRFKRDEVGALWLKRVSRTVESFVKAHPGLKCSKLTPAVASKWLGEDPSTAYEQTEISTLKAILKWGVDQRRVAVNPLANMRLPKGSRREAIILIHEHRKLIQATPNAEARCLLWFAWWTGSRPSELRALDWSQVSPDAKSATMRKHKTAKKTRKSRTIYFPPNAAALLKAYRKQSGPVFLNTRGKPWTKGAVVCLMKRLRKKTGIDGTAYAYRHSYATRALERGVTLSDLAELLGTSIEVIGRNYAHLDRAKARLSEIAASV